MWMGPGMPWASYQYPLLIPATAPIQLPERAAFPRDCPMGRPAPLPADRCSTTAAALVCGRAIQAYMKQRVCRWRKHLDLLLPTPHLQLRASYRPMVRLLAELQSRFPEQTSPAPP